MVFKLVGKVGQKVKGQGHKVTWRISSEDADSDSAVNGHINFKLGENYRSVSQRL